MRDTLAKWFAWGLPRRIIYHAIIRGWAVVSTGSLSDKPVSEITVDEMLRLLES